MEEIIKMTNITKRFGSIVANDNINIVVEKGSIHALLGENGSGKSTLMKILFGIYRSNEGEIYIRGKKERIISPTHALQKGICMIHQHFMLVPQLTVVENIIAGDKRNSRWINLKKAAQNVEELANKFGLRINPFEYIYNLSVGEQQRVEIVKTLYRGAEIMILDEPTAVLTPQETTELLQILRNFVNNGKTIILITHKLEEVMEFADTCTVLRNGKSSLPIRVKDTTKTELARLMVGRDVVFNAYHQRPEAGKVVAELSHVSAKNVYSKQVLNDICLKINAGEILGIAGVDGNGQVELSEAITGMYPISSGEICVDGECINGKTISDIIKLGVSYVPAERNGVGAIGTLSVRENMVLRQYKDEPYSRHGFLSIANIDSMVSRLANQYEIKMAGPDQSANLLSGGNLQKVILARELERKPKLLVCVYPTRGLDVGAIEYIQTTLLKEKEAGAAILLISTELEEILTLSDRIAVIYEGRIMGIEKNDANISVEKIGLMLAGVTNVEEGTQYAH